MTDVLPPRPLRVAARFYVRELLIALLLALLGLGALAAAVHFGAEGGKIVADGRIWDDGAPAVEARVIGERTSNYGFGWLLSMYDLSVDYTTADGDEYEGEFAFTTMIAGDPTSAALELRHDPERPERFMISWAHSVRGGRWRALVIFVLMFAMLAYGVAIAVRERLKIPAGVRATARGSEELVVPITRVDLVTNQSGEETTKRRYWFRDPASQDEHSVELDSARARPLFASDDERSAIALRRPGGAPILVPTSFYPFVVDPGELQGVTERVTALRRAGREA